MENSQDVVGINNGVVQDVVGINNRELQDVVSYCSFGHENQTPTYFMFHS